MKKTQKYHTTLAIDGIDIPVELVFERRPGARYAITSKRLTLRMPQHTSPEEVRHYVAQMTEWVKGVFAKKPNLRHMFQHKTYASGDVLQVGKRKYILEVSLEDRATHTARLIGDTIHLQLSSKAGESARLKSIRTLLSRVVAGDFYPEIARRVHEWNEMTFNRPIKNVYLKYNQTNWGSCSRDGNVNLSTRLLFAPDEVRDYVILHELAHLVELNHSDRYWALVERFMPDYRDKELWLKKFGATCDF